MRKSLILLISVIVFGCKGDNSNDVKQTSEKREDSLEKTEILADIRNKEIIYLNLDEANRLAELPLKCLETEYPNKLGQILENKDAIGEPHELHPAFYGCFDWHSSVHAHWSLVSLLKHFPELDKAEEIREKLRNSLSKANIQGEVAYFQRPESDTYERTYGWAWLLKLAQELKTWDDTLAEELDTNMQPLTEIIVKRNLDFLPKLNYPVRVGEHTNTAFGLSFVYDYAIAAQNAKLEELVVERSREFYLGDDNCPLEWEPGGYDFLSPCLQEVDLMRRVLPKNAFNLWIEDFMPQLKDNDFTMEVGEVSDRSDGKLVHLDGLNFSRAWVFYALAKDYPNDFGHLVELADKHVAYSFPNLMEDTYEGGHWLGTFAIYALQESEKID